MIRSKVLGTGSYAPEMVLTNHDLEKMVDTADDWIVERTGIRERRIADKDIASSDLAFEAAKRALKMADMKASQLDLIIVATVTPDMLFPATACILQAKLGAKNAIAFDISAACSGFIFALATADNFIKAGAYKNALVVGTRDAFQDNRLDGQEHLRPFRRRRGRRDNRPVGGRARHLFHPPAHQRKAGRPVVHARRRVAPSRNPAQHRIEDALHQDARQRDLQDCRPRP